MPQLSNFLRRWYPWWLIPALFTYFSAHVLLRVWIGDSLELDEAEQTILSQWWRLGYSPLPPLYTWIQRLFFAEFGLNVLALSVLKNGLLFIAYSSVFLCARKVCADTGHAALATLSLLLIPQIGWESQRDLAHSVIVLSAASVTLYMALRVMQTQSFLSYLGLGVLMGIGVLSNHNYWLFLLALAIALLWTSSGREAVLNRRIGWTLGSMVLIAAPYGLWFISHGEIAGAKLAELEARAGPGVMDGLETLSMAAVGYLTPLWLVYVILFPRGFLPSNRTEISDGAALLGRYLCAVCLILVIMVVLFDVTRFQTRWMQPLLFVVPIYFFAAIKPGLITANAQRRFFRVAGATALLILAVMGLRVLGAGVIDDCSDHNYPSKRLAEELRTAGFSDGLIITEPHVLAGNLRLQFPHSVVVAPRMAGVASGELEPGTPVALVWDKQRSPQLPQSIRDYSEVEFGVRVPELKAVDLDLPCRYANSLSVRVGYVMYRVDATGFTP